MTVESLMLLLAMSGTKCNLYDSSVVDSMQEQISKGLGFTEKQANMALRILASKADQLSVIARRDVRGFIENPTYEKPFRTIDTQRSITIEADPTYGKIVKFKFPYNNDLIDKIRKNKENLDFARWDPDEKSWIFALTETNIQIIGGLSGSANFVCDDEFQNYIMQIMNITRNMENYIPMLTLDGEIPKFANVSRNMPKLEATEILPAIFEARRRGIFAWDDAIGQYLDSGAVDHETVKFLKSDPMSTTDVDCEKMPMSTIKTIVENMMPCLIVIPGGNEMKKTEQAYDFIKSLGITDKEISVLFRLPSETGKNLNNFVKENHLNNPITESTKVAFISCKVPKTIVKSKLRFNCVVDMGSAGVHYSTKQFVQNHQNLVNFSEKQKQREFPNWLPRM